MIKRAVASLDAEEHPRYTLLRPGRVDPWSRASSALADRDLCRDDASFAGLLPSLTDRLQRIFRATAQHSVVLFDGDGGAAVESAIVSTVPRDGKILIVDNGASGERLDQIARAHALDIVHVRYAWGDRVEPRDVERAFEQHPDIEVVAVVHHETSVGLLNPITEIGVICRRFGAVFVVDAASSVGAEDLDVQRDNIDICASGADMCLHASSGVAILCVAPRLWPKIETLKARSHYLDLKRLRREMARLARLPFTPSGPAYLALHAACGELMAGGHARRIADYGQRNRRLRDGLAELGMAPFTRTGSESHSVVVCCIPTGLTFGELYDGLKARGYIVGECGDVLAETFVQIANMGDIDVQEIERFLSALGQVISSVRSKAKELAPGQSEPTDSRQSRPAA
ncbi:MAG: aminotransferase class V-fold PLP-dependent enzyme [Proteobacteria bacterium]|nr:aminotransferase class V-fold PLP-dependent enzyme [Pseudomonadota bacterium]